jgi:alkanesulfonate monooxygenase SsuD/methylene tetrahydromethanopterin reductase-like flavin-dependent oxidoreductase (luciferase family)
MTDFYQELLDTQAQILKLEQEKLDRIAQDIGAQNLPVAEAKAAIKAQSEENYRRHSLAAAIAVCLGLTPEPAIALADHLIAQYRDRQDLNQVILSRESSRPKTPEDRRALESSAWRELEEALARI